MDFLEKNLQKIVQNRKVTITIKFYIFKKSVGTKFQLKLKILDFWTKLAQKGYFQFKKEKRKITIEFCIFELV